MEKLIRQEPFKKLEIDCQKGFMEINGKEINVAEVTSIDIHIANGIIELEMVSFVSGDFGDGRRKNS